MNIILISILAVLTVFFIVQIRHSLKRSNKNVQLIEKYIDHVKNPEQVEKLLDEMFEFCSNDWKLSKIMIKHSATKDDFRIIFRKLMVWGNFRKYNRFVPITSFFYVTSLDFLLEHRDDDSKKLTERMMNFLHF